MMGHVNKTDKLDANGLATLLRVGSLPTVWLPPAALRDQRELPRTRMALTALRTSIKNRIHSLLAKYNLSPEDGSQLFSKKGRSWLESSLSRLPAETGRCLAQHLELLDFLSLQIDTLEERIHNLGFPRLRRQCDMPPGHRIALRFEGVSKYQPLSENRSTAHHARRFCRLPPP